MISVARRMCGQALPPTLGAMSKNETSAAGEPRKKDGRSGLALGICFGLVFGVALGAASDNLAAFMGVGIALGIAFGLIYDEQQKKKQSSRPKPRAVKVENGATFTLVERKSPRPGQRSHYWLGDNGQELELSDDEATELL